MVFRFITLCHTIIAGYFAMLTVGRVTLIVMY